MIKLAHRGLSCTLDFPTISNLYIATNLFPDDILSVDTTTSIYLRHRCPYILAYYSYYIRFIFCVLEILLLNLIANFRQACIPDIPHAF